MKNISDLVQTYGAQPAGPQDSQSNCVVTEQAIKVFNELFRQLRAAFPAVMATIKTQADLDELRRQWVAGFAENGITTISQVEAGMRIARQQDNPFLPSVGQFITWCKQGAEQAAGIPDKYELSELVKSFSRDRFSYPSIEHYPFKNKIHYWLVTGVYADMRLNAWTNSELLTGCENAIKSMNNRIQRGENIPEPITRLETKKINKPLGRAESLKWIRSIRLKLGL